MADKCETSPCSAVASFVGETRANIEHLKKDFEDMHLQTKECLVDMRQSAAVVKEVEKSLTAVAEITKQQNVRLHEGNERFVVHERRMGEIERQQLKISETMEGLPGQMQIAVKAAFDEHQEKIHKPLGRRIKYLFWGIAALVLFLLTTEHGSELLSFVKNFGLFKAAI